MAQGEDLSRKGGGGIEKWNAGPAQETAETGWPI